jgi:hypothetical protein
MKNILVLMTLTLSLNLFANQVTTWTGTYEKDGQTLPVEFVGSLYDKNGELWVESKEKIGTAETVENFEYYPVDFKQILFSCRLNGGNMETLTINAGTIQTCHFTSRAYDETGTLYSTDEQWAADIYPFFSVKQIVRDLHENSVRTIEITSF